MARKKQKPTWKIVVTHVDSPENPMNSEHMEFRTPDGRSLCRIRALPDGRIEFRSYTNQLLIEPVVSNVVYIELLK
jgi:hypothetical protein